MPILVRIRAELEHNATPRTTILFARVLQVTPAIRSNSALQYVSVAHLKLNRNNINSIKCTLAIYDEPITARPASCTPSPCGPNSRCQMVGGNPACSCIENFIGAPPSCRPECFLNQDCGAQEACIQQRCANPCLGSCGFEAKCHVLNHLPICTCNDGYQGDAFVQCTQIPAVTEPPRAHDPCNPSPCGPNTNCYNGECTCIADYTGNPYEEGCRPECSTSADCNRDRACMRSKCADPCPGTCGFAAQCEVVNHIPICSCPTGFAGDPFSNCRPTVAVVYDTPNPCQPSPCGANAQCRNNNDHAVCSCLTGFIGAPPQCRPECVVSSECSPIESCVNQKCVDACRGACGANARCKVFNHSPICSCNERETGDPFRGCSPLPIEPLHDIDLHQNPCSPSPCGPNSQCRVTGEQASCQCVAGYIGTPPNCRPECVINTDCAPRLVCNQNRCQDPCPGSCGQNAECRVNGHTVSCVCLTGYSGNPFELCNVVRGE